MERVLKIPFKDESGKTVTVSLADPKTGLTKAEVTTWQNKAINDDFIIRAGNSLTTAEEPYIYETNKVLLS